MTQDEIIRMAREAGFSVGLNDPIIYAAHERFAALVAAHTLKQANLKTLFDAVYSQQTDVVVAVLTEREACAKVCESLPTPKDATTLTHIPTLETCAAAIRARS